MNARLNMGRYCRLIQIAAAACAALALTWAGCGVDPPSAEKAAPDDLEAYEKAFDKALEAFDKAEKALEAAAPDEWAAFDKAKMLVTTVNMSKERTAVEKVELMAAARQKALAAAAPDELATYKEADAALAAAYDELAAAVVKPETAAPDELETAAVKPEAAPDEIAAYEKALEAFDKAEKALEAAAPDELAAQKASVAVLKALEARKTVKTVACQKAREALRTAAPDEYAGARAAYAGARRAYETAWRAYEMGERTSGTAWAALVAAAPDEWRAYVEALHAFEHQKVRMRALTRRGAL